LGLPIGSKFASAIERVEASMTGAIPGNYQYHALRKGNTVQRQWHKNKLNLIKYLNFLSDDDIVLDAGCGSGNAVLEFSKKVQYVVGIDNNERCIKFLRNKIDDLHIQNVRAEKLDLLGISRLNLKINKVIMTEVIEHLTEEYTEKMLIEIGHIIGTDGRILITTPNYRSLWPGLEKILDLFKLVPQLENEQHITKYNWKKLLDVIKRSNYGVIAGGTFNWVSPFVARLMPTFADKISYFEFSKVNFGNLFYVVLRRNIPG
jgi:2-polyprenyl-3-methyl-5-hydroxy-6-metoxy-1,4-benzoquinol methylase